MSTGRSAAKRAERQATEAAQLDRTQRLQAEEKLKKERERAQKLFIRQVRAKQAGGMFFAEANSSNTLG